MSGDIRMRSFCTACTVAILATLSLLPCSASAASPQAAQGPARAPALVQIVGTVKAISGTTITLAPDKGAEVTVNVQPGARVLRVAPGQTDLKTAATIQLSDVQVGDRILVRGKPSDDAKSFAAGYRPRDEAFRRGSQTASGTRRLAEARRWRLGQRR